MLSQGCVHHWIINRLRVSVMPSAFILIPAFPEVDLIQNVSVYRLITSPPFRLEILSQFVFSGCNSLSDGGRAGTQVHLGGVMKNGGSVCHLADETLWTFLAHPVNTSRISRRMESRSLKVTGEDLFWG